MSRTKIGLIGAGGVANFHLRALAEIEDAEVVAIVDIVRSRAEAAAQRYGITRVHDDYQQLLSDPGVEAVIVCTPTGMHAAPTIAALKAGKHVMVEKPMDAHLEAAREMVETAHRHERILMVALKLRFHPFVLAAREVVESGTLGKIYYAEAVAGRRRGNPGGSFVRKEMAGFGATADLGIYALDTALHLMGHPHPMAVSAVTSDHVSKNASRVMGQWAVDTSMMDVEDFAAAWIRFDNGARLVLKSSWAMNLDNLGGTFFLGEKAGLRIGVHEVQGDGPDGVKVFRDEFGTMTDVELKNVPNVDGEELFRREDRAFVAAVKTGGPSPIDPEGVLLTNVIIQAIIDSAAAGGREIEVDAGQSAAAGGSMSAA